MRELDGKLRIFSKRFSRTPVVRDRMEGNRESGSHTDPYRLDIRNGILPSPSSLLSSVLLTTLHTHSPVSQSPLYKKDHGREVEWYPWPSLLTENSSDTGPIRVHGRKYLSQCVVPPHRHTHTHRSCIVKCGHTEWTPVLLLPGGGGLTTPWTSDVEFRRSFRTGK